jgi:Domain of unknown function (DUF4328)/Protein of unknown function (DUF2510)
VSEHSGYPGASPGWYPDPAGGPGQRWWDGYAWTEATVLPERLPPPPPPPWMGAPPPPPGLAASVAPWAVASDRLSAHTTRTLVEGELRMSGVARIAVAVPAACSIATLVIDRINADRWLAYGHQMRIVWDDARNGITPPAYHGPSVWTPASLLVNLAFVAAAIVALMWQHRAASAGRALGLPSGQSPAWGVGSWFVPIVNFWIPYQAVRDCLPPGDPHRARVLHWWIAWLLATFLGVAVSITALFSSGTALALSVPTVLIDLAIIAWAPSIVGAIAAAHRSALSEQAQDVGTGPN